MSGGTVILAGTIRCPVEALGAFMPELKTMVAASRAEPGCIAYAQSESPSDPGLIHIFEHFENDAALAFHRASPHMAHWRVRLAELGVGERDMRQYDVSAYRPT
jgi:quinol monooxygenase YgiN